ncbi:Flp pilus assembly protein CpaB [Caenimonas soli]|uniref:Flp pilus assembly protein CpaB n=1 Tax=Caenimonas soli TaxID=2735555 RepID=UPI0015574275|nr:Flp pilus assembly protein CpaB [Caenimonas soli]NPC55474.1 Flp pilus assembly protein CpaB [Caenimonas soli]
MKNMKAIGLLILAIITGLAAAVYAASWIAQRGNIASTKVVVAAVDMELGSKINPQMVQTVDWPSSSLPDGAFKDGKDLEERVVKVSVQRGEPILERKLAPAGTKGGLSAVIADGKRAMTVRVNDVVGVAGFALPGNYVDVMVNTQQDRGNGQQASQISMTVLEKVLVLAVAQEAGRDDTKPKVVSAVTLELAPGDAEKLDLARSVGTLSLVLRNQLDKNNVVTAGITRDQLLGLKQTAITPVAATARPIPVATRPAAPSRPIAVVKANCVEVIRNGTLAMSCF